MRDPGRSTIIDAFAHEEPPPRGDSFDHSAVPFAFHASESRSIGEILIDTGRLLAEDAERVAQYQREHNLHFGEAAIRLGAVTREDVEYALSQQFEYEYLLRGESRVDPSIISAYDPFSPEVEALRALRTQLLMRLMHLDRKRSRLAVVSAESHDGRSHLAANLAVVFSQLGERTLLIDADLRHPKQHRLFGLENRTGLSSILAGRSGFEAVQRVPSLRDLSLLPAGAIPPNPQELIGRAVFRHMLDRFSTEYNIVILDTPAASRHAESLTIAARAGAALVVARRDATRLNRVRDMAQSLTDAHTALVGAVLNEF
jgi:receptor protein-tyrosine kinase